MKRFNNVLWGIVLVAVGVVFGLKVLGVTDFDVFFDGWWTLFIIIPCFVGLVSSHERMGNLIGLIIGVLLLLACRDLFSFSLLWKLALPLIVVLIGLRLIFRELFANKSRAILKKIVSQHGKLPEYYATFSENKFNFDDQIFTGAQFTAVFGSVRCDLRRAIITEDAVINISSIFGGVDIELPENVNVKISSNSIFGGVSNKKRSNSSETAITVYINANCVFGGVDIK